MWKKILIADHDEFVRDFLTNFCEARDFDVIKATTPDETIQIVEKEMPHAMFLALEFLAYHINEFPTNVGFGLLVKIREVSPTTQIIVLSIKSDSKTVEKVLQAGANEYIEKPFSLAYLEEVLSRLYQP